MSNPLASYGTDLQGWICGFLFSASGKAPELDSRTAAEWLKLRTRFQVAFSQTYQLRVW